MNGAKLHFEKLRDDAEWASIAFLRECFAGTAGKKILDQAGAKVIEAVHRLRDSGEEW